MRERVVEAGSSRQQAAERFGVGKASAIRWHAHFRDAGQIAPKPAGGDRSPPATEAHTETILEVCRERTQIILRELRDRLAQQGVRTSTSGLWRFFARHGIIRKKGALHADEHQREDVRAARDAWLDEQHDLDLDSLVFIDETAAATIMARPYGRSLRGERCRISAPHGHVWTPPRVQVKSLDGRCA